MDATNDQNVNDFGGRFLQQFNSVSFADVLPKINNLIQTSISDNFQAGGRFGNDNQFGGGSNKWIVSKRAKQQSGMTLQDRGSLAKSIRVSSYSQNGRIVVTIGSNLKYAAHQHFGSKEGGFKHPGGTSFVIRKSKGVTKAKFVTNKYAAAHPEKIRGITKAHQIILPARPYLVLQNRDLEDIGNLIINQFFKIFR